MVVLPVPELLDCQQLAAEIEAAGFTDVVVAIVGDGLVVNAAELMDPMPPATDRDACETQDELDALIADGAERAAVADASARAAIAAIVGGHVPTAPPELTPAELVAARIGLPIEVVKKGLGL